jgi:type I restriction enzyme S subunit
MSFPRYPEYKDSGVEWLGEVPGHWKAVPLKTVSTHNDDVLDESTTPDAEIAYVDISSVDGINGIKTKEDMLFSAAPSRARRRVKHGDVIVSTVRTYLKAIARIRDPEENLVVSTGFAVIRPRGELAPDFLGHLVSAGFFVDQVIARSTGVSYPAINASELVAIPVPVPPLPEQTQIAAFLDRETAKIDGLVAEQRRLMALLKEKRQAVISHAVTRGLNPHAPMKPSGIEWLGDVPEHWEVSRIKRVASIRYGIGEPPKYHPEGTPLIRATNVHAGKLFDEGMVFVDPAEIPAQRIVWLTPGDIIVVRSGAYTGDSAIIPSIYGTCIAGFDMVLRCHSANPAFIQFVLLSKYLKEGQIDLEKMRAAQPHLNAEELGSCVLVLPDAQEQNEITSFLETESGKFDTLITEAQRAIDLLQERRTALISAAATGQIDVRVACQGVMT